MAIGVLTSDDDEDEEDDDDDDEEDGITTTPEGYGDVDGWWRFCCEIVHCTMNLQ